jgi:Cu-processing system permease protein
MISNGTIHIALSVTNPADTEKRARGSCIKLWKPIITIARKEFGDRFRSGWVIACAAVWLGAICLTSFFGLIQIGQIGVQGYERTVMSLLNLVQYVVPLLALLIGHDLVAAEREERTLALILSTRLTREQFLAGKFLGGMFTISFPLVLGFIISGVVIGLNASASGLLAFVKLALTGLVLGIIFLSAGLAISSIFRTRVQTLVMALLTWCFAVFAFDLVALGVLLALKSPTAAQEIEVACDPMHVNAAAEIHSSFENPSNGQTREPAAQKRPSFSWILINPVDLLRTMNLPAELGLGIPLSLALATTTAWIGGLLTLSFLVFRSQDL